MKPRFARQNRAALTWVEVLVVIGVLAAFVLVIITLLIVPANQGQNLPNTGIMCVSNLRQIGLTCYVWAGDHGGDFPMRVSMTNNGAMELTATGNIVTFFQVMSNQFPTPKILLCPADKNQRAATEFTSLKNPNISYFVGLSATATSPQILLSGDDNLMVNGKTVQSGILNLHASDALTWTKERHQGAGNILLADGSVHQATSADLTSTVRLATNRLAIP
ncbi:MAG TPA: H-X9-DG-CTERM domain-containing protein [Candidatus Acidoferrales bacterium]|nr:H-X9-DG-CTERM domain-containing protein [Candidatus Acidoferrales bacterium]